MDDPETLLALLDSSHDKLVVLDEEGTCVYANAALDRLLGYHPDEFVGDDALSYVHPDDLERVRDAFEGVVAGDGERTADLEYRYRRADGSWVWLESRLSNRASDTIGGYLVSSRDVTDRKRAAERLRESERRLEQVAANTDEVLWMFTGDWSELLFVNDAYEDLWGMRVADLEEDATRFLDGVHPEDRDRVVAAMERLSAGEPVDLEYRVNPGLDFRRWVWVQGAPVVEDGEVTRVVGFARDVTDRRRRERQLQVIDNLLRHNLRNDMNVVLGHAEQCADEVAPPVAARLETIARTGRGLLETAEKERDIVEVLSANRRPERLDMVAILEGVLEDVREAHPDVDVDATVPPQATALALPGVRRAVFELVENAVDHAESDPSIRVVLETTDESVEIAIRDANPPIPDNEVGPLFADGPPSDVYHGTGLGLWLAYWIVDRSDGDISFERTTDGEGNLVRLSFDRDVDCPEG